MGQPTASLVLPNDIRSVVRNGIVSSLLIIYILRNFFIKRPGQVNTSTYNQILEAMERFLTRIRSGSLRRKTSKINQKEEKRALDPGDLKEIEKLRSESAERLSETTTPRPTNRVSNDQLSISLTPPAAYGSIASLVEAPTPNRAEAEPKASSRRSSLSKHGKKHAVQHVDFQSPTQEARDHTRLQSPPPIATPSRTSSRRRVRSKIYKSHLVRSLNSLISNATTSKLHQPRQLKRAQSKSSIRRLAAYKAVDDSFPTKRPAYIAIGSGALMLQVVERISQFTYSQLADVTFISTGVASEHIMASYKLRPITSLNLLSPETKIDVYFDTAEEVDDELNCIRGGTGNLHLERMVALRSECFVCIVDYHKRVPTLFTMGKSMTVEITPESYFHVLRELRSRNATATPRRGEPAISGLCTTNRGTYLIDVAWPTLQNSHNEVERLADMVKSVYGVVDHGLFYAGGGGWNGRPNKVYVGLEDGAVDTLAGG
ncbi:hypothetical protein ABW20_dc0100054 [Dactylellina cionopaga]|nr:hypothetical protein ABW20_dc0100054 [Dactylellina cionopaga]